MSSRGLRGLKRGLSLSSAVLALGLAVACGGKKSTSDVAVATTVPGNAAQSTASSGKPTIPAAPPTSIVANQGPASAANEPLSFSTSDGVTIKGHLFAPSGAKRRALIIASSADQKTFAQYATQFAGQGIALYTFDQRGVGETGGSKNDAQMDKDLDIAVGLISSRDYPLVYLFAIGSEAGDAAVKVASKEQIAGVATYGAGASASSTKRITVANPQPADPLSVAETRQQLLDFVLGR